jgi:hypothetical protein
MKLAEKQASDWINLFLSEADRICQFEALKL